MSCRDFGGLRHEQYFSWFIGRLIPESETVMRRGRTPGTTGMPYINNWKNIRKMIKYSGTYYFYGMEGYYETD